MELDHKYFQYFILTIIFVYIFPYYLFVVLSTIISSPWEIKMKTVEMNLYLIAEQYLIVISLKHHLLNCIQRDDKIACSWVIVSYFPSSDHEPILIWLSPHFFLQAAPTCKMSAPE